MQNSVTRVSTSTDYTKYYSGKDLNVAKAIEALALLQKCEEHLHMYIYSKNL